MLAFMKAVPQTEPLYFVMWFRSFRKATTQLSGMGNSADGQLVCEVSLPDRIEGLGRVKGYQADVLIIFDITISHFSIYILQLDI